ncbi:MAG: epoxyqueuosine reductase [Deltaproteobacteria bacterium]|nr:epoxyqueuosine reductase [Deltaproteobacteria bacterium]
MTRSSELREWIGGVIAEFVLTSPENTMWGHGVEKAWSAPLVGFARGDDPLFEEFKHHVGPFHWTPAEIFNAAFPETKAAGSDLTVISFVLPQTDATKEDNRKETIFPAERWARTRVFGEEVNVKLRLHVVSSCRTRGIQSVAPSDSSLWSWQTSERYGFASNWSERHVAYASGLGTFGLCDGLITARGKAMRVGSVVARVAISPTPRPYKDFREYCLHFSGNGCDVCARRCPAGAITDRGHDKMKCFEYLAAKIVPHVKSNFGFEGYGCGLCQTAVPCESGIPRVSREHS